ncbi:MAG: SET domain-containing protein [Proteobacteria bacterium]|nr:SET domain-containing protein [Pseudomonadota bacterium]
MIIPCTKVVYINEDKGNGVVATARIPQGTVTWVFDDLDREIPMDRLERMSLPCQEATLTYSYRNNRGHLIFCWDNERFINHSFKPNCCLTAYNFEIAIRNIEPGEELTNDYGAFNIIAPFAVDSEGSERTTVYPDDLLRYNGLWDGQLQEAFSRFLHVEQPLRQVFSPDVWKLAESIARGETAMASIRNCYYSESR